MTDRQSLDARYFDDIFASDDDPWDLASSAYEAAKFDRTVAALADRRYGHALEIGCAHGVLTARIAPLCAQLLAIDISEKALAGARARLGGHPGVSFAHLAFPRETPAPGGHDLVLLSEVAYYWSRADLDRAAAWLAHAVAPAGRLVLVHYTGETDYPHSGDEAVAQLRAALGDTVSVARQERHDRYRLDLWERR